MALGLNGSGHPVELKPLDPHDPTHVAEFRRQRILCGWGVERVDKHCRLVIKGVKNLLWIWPTTEDFELPEEEMGSFRSQPGPPPPDPSFRPLGHVSLDWEDSEGDISLASKEEKRVTLSTFFILKSQQGKGLGSLVMNEVERLAGLPPFNAEIITLNTLAPSAASSLEFWENLGVPYDPSARVTADWYKRRGYEAYKEQPRYQEKDKNGIAILLPAIFMRKKVIS